MILLSVGSRGRGAKLKMSERTTLGVILAGGRSSRFAGANKALAELRGRSLIGWAVARLTPQVDALAINTHYDAAYYASFDLPLIPDLQSEFEGPVAGIVAALFYARAHNFHDLVTVACDVPDLPHDLVVRLRRARHAVHGASAFVQVNERLNPVFALYNVSLTDKIADAFASGTRAARDLAVITDGAIAVFADGEAGHFTDIDTAEDLAAAEIRPAQ